MASNRLKDIPPEVHSRLKQEADANYRSLTQKALFRLEQSFQIEDIFSSKRVQAWIEEASASGPEEALSREKFDAALRRGLKAPKEDPLMPP